MLGILQLFFEFSEFHIQENFETYKLQKQMKNFITLRSILCEQNLIYGIGFHSWQWLWLDKSIRWTHLSVQLLFFECMHAENHSRIRILQPNARNRAGSEEDGILICCFLLDDDWNFTVLFTLAILKETCHLQKRTGESIKIAQSNCLLFFPEEKVNNMSHILYLSLTAGTSCGLAV